MQVVKMGCDKGFSDGTHVACVLLAWLLFCGLLLGVVKFAHRYDDELARLKEEREEKWKFVFNITSEQSWPKVNKWWQDRDHEGLVDWMEREFELHERYVADLGGLDGLSRGFYGPAIGFSTLSTSYSLCADYNARYTARNVEFFLMFIQWDTHSYSQTKLELFEIMAASKHPVIKAYGLWFLMDMERWEKSAQYWSDMKEGQSYPHITAYVDHVYGPGIKGEKWALGFAVDASRYDSDMPRVMDLLIRYQNSFEGKYRGGGLPGYVDGRVLSMAGRPKEEIDALNAEQISFIHDVLDRQLRTGYRVDSRVVRMCEIMNRRSDIGPYVEYVELAKFISLLTRTVDRPKLAIVQENADRMHLIEDFMQGCLEDGNFEGYSEYTARQIFEIMGREAEFNSLYPPKPKHMRRWKPDRRPKWWPRQGFSARWPFGAAGGR